jgi:hypothetical protein
MSKQIVNSIVPSYVCMTASYVGCPAHEGIGDSYFAQFASFSELIQWLRDKIDHSVIEKTLKLNPFAPEVKLDYKYAGHAVDYIKVEVADREQHFFPWKITRNGVFDNAGDMIDAETLEHYVNNDYLFMDKWRSHDRQESFGIFAEMKPRWRQQLLDMLGSMAACGDMGCSRQMQFYADGDGDFRPKFAFDEKLYTPTTGQLKLNFDAG